MTTSSRKLDHIRICLEKPVEANSRPFDDLVLIHKALPEINEADIDTTCRFLGKRLSAPLIIGAMTGGHPLVKEINVRLAEAASELGIALGVGSQRAALEDKSLEDTFSAVRDVAPDIPIIGNIGAVQLKRSGPEVLDRLAEMIDADAVAVHLNFLQESIQPEGDKEASGILEAIESAARGRVPIIVKEDVSLRLSYLRDFAALVPSTFGVPEPIGSEIPARGEDVDTIILPMLGYDHTGGRIGYGAGYYDRFLEKYPGLRKIGIAFACQEIDVLPLDDTDVRMDHIITEKGIVYP